MWSRVGVLRAGGEGLGGSAQVVGLGPLPGDDSARRVSLIFEIDLLEVVQASSYEPLNTAGLDTLELDSGLKIIIAKIGKGPKATFGRQVVAHYTGYLPDGKIFDSSYLHGQPISFQLGSGQVIKGWDEAFSLLPQGTKARLIIPPHLAYGNNDVGSIPAGSTLIFDVEVVDVK